METLLMSSEAMITQNSMVPQDTERGYEEIQTGQE